jgi:hypothetical protein
MVQESKSQPASGLALRCLLRRCYRARLIAKSTARLQSAARPMRPRIPRRTSRRSLLLHQHRVDQRVELVNNVRLSNDVQVLNDFVDVVLRRLCGFLCASPPAREVVIGSGSKVVLAEQSQDFVASMRAGGKAGGKLGQGKAPCGMFVDDAGRGADIFFQLMRRDVLDAVSMVAEVGGELVELFEIECFRCNGIGSLSQGFLRGWG